MNEALHNHDLITRYLDGELSPEEEQQFNQRMQNDAAFRLEVESMQLAVESVKYYGTRTKVAAVRQQMKGEVSKGSVKVIGIRKIARYGLSVAATLFFVFIVIEGYQFYKLSSDVVYNDAYISYSTGTRGEEPQSDIKKAYSNKSYSEVVGLAANRATGDEEKFLVGLSYLELNQPGAAAKWFEVLNNDESNFKQDAEFYLALSYLKSKNYDRSLELLENIYNNTTHTYHERVSKKLLRKIRMLKWK
jgi:hypothetical protein